MKKFLPLALVLVSLLSGCTVTQSLAMTSGDAGSAVSEIQVDPFFTTLLEDFSSIAPTTTQYTLMEEAMVSFSSSIAQSQYSEYVSLKGDGSGRNYFLSFSFSDIIGLIGDLENAGSNTIFTTTDHSLSFHIGMDNYHELKDAIPFLSDPNFEVYGPEYNNGMSEEEYREMIWFLLGDDGPDALDGGKVDLTITVPGTIESVIGAIQNGENAVTFSFPIIDFLLLNEPLEFSVSWK